VSVPDIVNPATLDFIEPRRYVDASTVGEPVGIPTVKETTQLAPGRRALVEETGMLIEVAEVESAPTVHGPDTTDGVMTSRPFAERSAQKAPDVSVLASVAGVAEVAAFVRVKVSFCPRWPGTKPVVPTATVVPAGAAAPAAVPVDDPVAVVATHCELWDTASARPPAVTLLAGWLVVSDRKAKVPGVPLRSAPPATSAATASATVVDVLRARVAGRMVRERDIGTRVLVVGGGSRECG
jgi:hypothetical protein